MEQPSICEPVDVRKQCWGCTTFIPYTFGFCSECWSMLNEAEQVLLGYSAFLAPTLGGALRLALVRHVQALRRPKPAYTYTPKVKRALPTINLSLEDLEL